MSARQAARVLGVGLSPLVPLPWVDGVISRKLLAQSFAAEAQAAGVDLDDEALRVLTEAPPWRIAESMRGAARSATRWPLRRLLGPAGAVFNVKRCLDEAADAALRVEMVRQALAAGVLPHRAAEVRAWMDAALSEEHHSPLGRALLRGGLGVQAERWGAGEDAASAAVGRVLVMGDGPQVLARFAAALGKARGAGTR